jgi:hypothetical protein
MAEPYATGNLADVDDTGVVLFPGNLYTGALGIQLVGAFGGTGGTVTLRAGSEARPGNHKLFVRNPDNAARVPVVFSEVGLYFIEAFLGGLVLLLQTGEDGVTDIDWTIYLKSRP